MDLRCEYGPGFLNKSAECWDPNDNSEQNISIESPRMGLSFASALEARNWLLVASLERPILLIFLRQIGCVFAREAVATYEAERAELEAKGIQSIFVHMSDWDSAEQRFVTEEKSELPHFSDPARGLYQIFGLERASLGQILHPIAIFRAAYLFFRKGYRVGYGGGDCLQMPGVVLLDHGDIRMKYQPKQVGERISYLELVT